MSGTSTKTELITLRVSVDVMKRARVNAMRNGVSVREYLQGKLAKELGRKR